MDEEPSVERDGVPPAESSADGNTLSTATNGCSSGAETSDGPNGSGAESSDAANSKNAGPIMAAPKKPEFIAPAPMKPSAKPKTTPQAIVAPPEPPPAPSAPTSRSAPAGSTTKSAYTPPLWSSKPQHAFSLEVLKDGASVEVFKVAEKPFYIMGRHPETCDIVMQHPSISRQHAVVQNRDTGDIYLCDLGSTHGSFVNKKQIEPNTHVPLRVGDVLKFGQSSRLYVVQGPPNLMPQEGPNRLERAKIQYLMHRAQEKQAERDAMQSVAANLTADGASWGFGEDAQDDEEEGEGAVVPGDEDALTAQTKGAVLTEKQRGLLEKLQAKKAKLDNLRSEIDRIQAKESSQGMLTEGQARQIARNEERITQLMTEVEDAEDELRDELRASKRKEEGADGARSKRRRGDSDDDYSSDEDDFYDRTVKQQKKKQAAKAEAQVDNADTLAQKRAVAEAEHAALLETLASLDGAPSGETPASKSDGDALDDYMSSIKARDDKDQHKKLEQRIAALKSEMDRFDRLIQLVQPALPDLAPARPKPPPTGTVAAPIPSPAAPPKPPVEESAVQRPSALGPATQSAAAAPPGSTVSQSDASSAEAPVAPEESASNAPRGEPEEAAHESQSGAAPGVEISAALGPSQNGADRGGGEKEEESGSAATVELVPATTEPVPATIKAIPATIEPVPAAPTSTGYIIDPNKGGLQVREKPHVAVPAGDSKSEPEKKPPRDRKKKGPAAPAAQWETAADEVDAVWLPPQNQTGDGRTKLNEKYGY